jgi:hypothetical protein
MRLLLSTRSLARLLGAGTLPAAIAEAMRVSYGGG